MTVHHYVRNRLACRFLTVFVRFFGRFRRKRRQHFATGMSLSHAATWRRLAAAWSGNVWGVGRLAFGSGVDSTTGEAAGVASGVASGVGVATGSAAGVAAGAGSIGAGVAFSTASAGVGSELAGAATGTSIGVVGDKLLARLASIRASRPAEEPASGDTTLNPTRRMDKDHQRYSCECNTSAFLGC